ncbi:hypothetical protein [Mesorhizobium sp. RMAD-H1]|uniref:hypothetical protein n=1 Tax=Mesorhizobium sp. RMAD-H1 TaxID=2587065 RepID=UPI00161A1ECF|nr:hypothetical protein [Mesorhizobium sp. RMAD-H1]MBB2974338.1 hypothetical protein [Mesorhizobium sp. RMAD-H1]
MKDALLIFASAMAGAVMSLFAIEDTLSAAPRPVQIDRWVQGKPAHPAALPMKDIGSGEAHG